MEQKDIWNLKVLYVEDEADTSEPLIRFLKRRFSKVIVAKDGREGYRKFCETFPDIIITDLLMQDFSGIEMIEKIRAAGYANPIIITSALRDIESIVKTVDLGVSKYIIKPIKLKELEDSLHHFAQEAVKSELHALNYSETEKKNREATISYLISAIIKKHTGKGPKDVKVFIGNDRIEVSCINALTILENALLGVEKNISFVEHIRILLYDVLKREMEEALLSEVGFPVKLADVKVDCTLDVHRFQFYFS